jgi:hypothetical protein
MSSVQSKFDQVLEAALGLPPREQKRLVKTLSARPSRAEALKVARRLRPQFRLTPKKEKRLSLLLRKGNAGTQTPAEGKEADALVEEVEAKMLEFAEAVDAELADRARPRSRNGALGR